MAVWTEKKNKGKINFLKKIPMGQICEDYKNKLKGYTKINKIRRNMLIMIAKSKENHANEIVNAIEFFENKDDYKIQINDLINVLIEKSKIYAKLLIKKPESAPSPQKKRKLSISSKMGINNLLDLIPYPPSYKIFNIVNDKQFEHKNAFFNNLTNKNIRSTIFNNFNQKSENFKHKMPNYAINNNNKKLENSKEKVSIEKNFKNFNLHELINKMFKPLICNFCGKGFLDNNEDKFKYNCHLKNHEKDERDMENFEDYKNAKPRDFFPQLKTYESRFKSINLYLPSLDDFNFGDDKIYVTERRIISCNKCGKSIDLKKDGMKYLVCEAKKVGVDSYAHKLCI